MSTYVGRSGVIMRLPKITAAGLVRNSTIVEVDPDISRERLAELVRSRFKTELTPEPKTPKPEKRGVVEKPRGNASRDDWVAYAVSQGKAEEDLVGLKQGEIRALFEDGTEETQNTGEEQSSSSEGTTGQANSDTDE